MKKIISVTLALSIVGNVAFANGSGSEIVEPIRQAEEDLIDLESRLNETVDKYSAMEDKLIEIEIEKHHRKLRKQQNEIKELNNKIKARLEFKDALISAGSLYIGITATVHTLLFSYAAMKGPKIKYQMVKDDLLTSIGDHTKIFAVLVVAGLVNDYYLFETREELAEFQQLVEQTELKLQKEIEALNQN